MSGTANRARRVGPRELSVRVTPRYRLMWGLNRMVVRSLFRLRVDGADHLPPAPYQLVCNHHNGFDPLIMIAAMPLEPRITWFGPKERDFSRGFKNRVMTFFGGVIPYDPDKTTLMSAVRAVRRVFAADGVLGIFAEGRAGLDETSLLPFEDGAAAFAAASGVPIVPCAIIGSTRLWVGRTIIIRFGAPIDSAAGRSREGRAQLERDIHAGVAALLPDREPRAGRIRPFESLLTDLLNGPEVAAERRRTRRHG